MTRRLSKVFKKKRQQETDDHKFLFTDCVPKTVSSLPWSLPKGAEQIDDDDSSSMSSFSTTATVDNNPGPGRLIDNFLYQRLGRKLERGILKFRIYTGGLSPFQICQFILDKFPDNPPVFGRILRLNSMLGIKEFDHGATTLAGLNNLMQQTR